MKQRYTQLTQEERYCLYTMRKQAISLRVIAKAMGRSHTTLSRELKRNIGQKGYRHHQAQRLAERRHQEKPKAMKLTETVRTYLHEKLHAWWSPEQIRGRLQLEEAISISLTTVYRFVLKDTHQGGQLYRGLRHQAKPRRKRYGAKDYRGTIPGRVDIADRPAVVDTRSRVGDWEADLIIGKDHQGAIVTLAERRSRLFLAIPILRKTAELTTRAITTLLETLKDWVHTITYDNGREFSGHATIAKALACQGYFARPYHSWERGLNENSNGLLRQYFPKGMRLNTVSNGEVFAAVEAMNHRPRKCLGFQTPWEVFTKLTQTNRPEVTSGALMG
jgi:IS30 family transposase